MERFAKVAQVAYADGTDGTKENKWNHRWTIDHTG